MTKIVSWCALAISMVALSLAWWVYDQLDQRVDDAVARREKTLVQQLEPRVRQFCDEFEVDYPTTSPDTLDELVRPLVEIVEGMTGDN